MKTTNKETKKEFGTIDIIATGGVFTALAAPFSVPIAIGAGVVTALGAVATSIIDKDKKKNSDMEYKYYLTKWDQIFYSNKVYAGNLQEGIRLPKLQRVTETKLGKNYIFKLPIGIESSDIKKIATSIKDAYDSLRVEVELIGPQLIEVRQQFMEDEDEKLFEGSIPSENWNDLWRAIRLTTKDEYTGDLIYPILTSEFEENEIKTFIFKLPIGRSSAFFYKEGRDVTVREFLGARQIKIEPLNGNKIQIKAIYKELPTLVKYELLPRDKRDDLEVVLGKSISGWKKLRLLSGLHNVFISGCTGSGKSICGHVIITDLALNYTPNELEMRLSDLKNAELPTYRKLKHVTEFADTVDDTLSMIGGLLEEMKRRQNLLNESNSKKLSAYNSKVSSDKKMPYILFVVEEMATLTLNTSKKQLAPFVELLSKARSVGIIIICTSQRVVNDYIPRNVSELLMNRLCFKVTTEKESELLTEGRFNAKDLRGNGHGCLIDVDVEEFQCTFLDEDKGEITNLLKQHNLLRD